MRSGFPIPSLFGGFGKGVLCRQSGLSLIELLVAMGLGLILVVGIGTVYLGSRQTYRMQEANARVQETGRFALEVIGRSLRQAGADANLSANVTAVADECITTLPCEESGGTCSATSAAPTGTTCDFVGGVCVSTNHQCFALQGKNGAGSASDAISAQFFVEVGGGTNCNGDNAQADDVVTNTFSLNGTDLRCSGRIDRETGGVVSNVASTTQPLVSEIEDLQVIYGVDSDANQSADIYTAAPTAGQWPNVVTAKVCVMVRSTDQGLAPSGQRPLDCARALGTATGAAPAIADTRLHRAFVATYNLRNRVTNTP